MSVGPVTYSRSFINFAGSTAEQIAWSTSSNFMTPKLSRPILVTTADTLKIINAMITLSDDICIVYLIICETLPFTFSMRPFSVAEFWGSAFFCAVFLSLDDKIWWSLLPSVSSCIGKCELRISKVVGCSGLGLSSSAGDSPSEMILGVGWCLLETPNIELNFFHLIRAAERYSQSSGQQLEILPPLPQGSCWNSRIFLNQRRVYVSVDLDSLHLVKNW